MKKSFSPGEKAVVALEAIKGELTTSQIASKYSVHPTQVGVWKSQALKSLPDLFSDKRKKENFDKEKIMDELYRTIGKRDMDIAWLKKKIEPFEQ